MIAIKTLSVKYFGLISIIFLLIRCTYDKSLIYRKGYEIKDNSSPRFSGFYNGENKKIMTEAGNVSFMYPIFFYEDGSVIFMGATKDTSQLRKTISENPNIWGYWGNYQISNDTIKIETIASYGGSLRHERHIKIGLLNKDNIYFFQELDKKGKIEKTNETVQFVNFNAKPNSTANWIRQKKKYNK